MENNPKTSSSNEPEEEFFMPETKGLELAPTSVQDLVALSKQLDAARVEYETATEMAKVAGKKKSALELRLWDELLEAGLDKLPRNDGVTFERSEKLWFKVTDEDQLTEYFKNAGEINDFTKLAWESARLNARIKELMQKQEPLHPGLSYAVTRVISRTTRRSAKKVFASNNSQYKGEGTDGEVYEI